MQAYYDKSKVTPEAVDAYRLPQLVRGWESGESGCALIALLIANNIQVPLLILWHQHHLEGLTPSPALGLEAGRLHGLSQEGRIPRLGVGGQSRLSTPTQ